MAALSKPDFDDLWDAIHRSRKHSKHVDVPKRLLENLLMDYADLYDKVNGTPGGRAARWKGK